MADRDFEAPPFHDAAPAPYQPAAEAVAAAAGPLGQAFTRLADHLERRVTAEGTEIFAASADDFSGIGNVVGVGLGEEQAGAGALNLYLVEPMNEDEVREVVAAVVGPEAGKVPIRPLVTGEIEAAAHTVHLRPAPGGISVGHLAVGAGTLGCLAQGRSAPRDNRLLILGNNHVLAASNAGSFGDEIVQPGPLDGGVAPAYTIARLERFVPLDFTGAPNVVDCATAWAHPGLVRPELLRMTAAGPTFFSLAAGTVPCSEDLQVGKSGRTTQVTTGRILDCNATIRVRFNGQTALFRDQISVRGAAGSLFAARGDSGAVVWRAEDRRPVGLLFAVGGEVTFVNKIHHVLAALDIDLVV
jgi:hypothetical protein